MLSIQGPLSLSLLFFPVTVLAEYLSIMSSSADEFISLLSDKHRSLVHFNARSLRKNHDNISDFIHSTRHPFSFICISETWLSDDDADLYGFTSYKSEYCHRASDAHGGSAIFISPGINYSRRTDLSIAIPYCESIWIEIQQPHFTHNENNLILASIYRSPSSSLTQFLSALETILNNLSLEHKNILLVGDININLLDSQSNSTIAYNDCLLGYGLMCLIDSYTRSNTRGTNTLLDHAFSNFSPQLSGVVDVDITDHYPIFITFDSPVARINTAFTATRFDQESFFRAISNCDWSKVSSQNDPESAVDTFSSLVSEAVSSSTHTTAYNKRYQKPQNPWMTSALLTSLRKKDNLYRKVKKQPFNNALALRYKGYCNILNSLVKLAKKRYYNEEFIKNKNNPKRQWKLFNEFLNSPAINPPITKITHHNATYCNSDDIANAFSEYFCLPSSCSNNVPSPNLPRLPHSFFLFPSSSDEIVSAIRNLKNTSPGLDNICAHHLKMVAHFISQPLTHIINLIYTKGSFPDSLKRAKVIPIFKKGDKDAIKNYRPISILPSLSKLIEHLFVKRLNAYLSKFNVIKPSQFGFRHGSSTNHALLSLTDFIKHSIDSGNFSGSVFLDLTKAFDTLNHSILFNKLDSYGITGPPLNFLKSYLFNRQNVVFTGGSYSNTKITNQGVPQGSILGPLLFIIYINDLPDVISSAHCVLYADDTTVSCKAKTVPSLISKLNSVLNNVVSWCNNNDLTINPSKTQFMIFRSPQKHLLTSAALTMGPNTIYACDSVSFLGVRLDITLNFGLHLSDIKKKTAFGIRALIKARPYFSTNALLSLYFSFVHSHFNYGITTWANTYHSYISSVQHIQNQAIRIITFSPRRSNAISLLRQYNILCISKLFEFHCTCLFFNIINRRLPFDLINYDLLKNTNRTRFALEGSLLLPRVRTNYGIKSLSFTAISLWNSIPPNIKSLTDLYTFKKTLKLHLLSS